MTFSQVRSKLKASHQKRGDRTHGLQKLRDTRNSSNPFAQRLGIFVEEIGPGYAGR